jgi:hypothetical protein
MAPEVGLALVNSLCLCLATYQHRHLELHRLWNGDFVRRTYTRGTFVQTVMSRRERVGPLLDALDAAPNFGTSVNERRYSGIPQLGPETDLAGALLIRLFETAERVKADVYFEYTPWAQKPLRYRLRYVLTPSSPGPDYFRFLHGPNAQAMLLQAITFLISADADR